MLGFDEQDSDRSVRCSKIFVYLPLRQYLPKLLPQLLQEVPADNPCLLAWADRPVWTPTAFMQAAAWAGSTDWPIPLTVVTSWWAWTQPPSLDWITVVRRRMPMNVRWIWAVPRESWSEARMTLQAIIAEVLPDDERLDPQFTGWVVPR